MTTGWMALTIASAFYTLRRLNLPFWWILFPPMVQGIFVGNPHILCLALLLSGSSWLRALAVPMKAYARSPWLPTGSGGRWRSWRLPAAISLVVFWPLWNTYRIDFCRYSHDPGRDLGRLLGLSKRADVRADRSRAGCPGAHRSARRRLAGGAGAMARG